MLLNRWLDRSASQPLTDRETVAARANNSVVPPRQTACEGSEAQVRPEGVVEEVGVVSNRADHRRHAVEREIADVVTMDEYRARARVTEALDEQRALDEQSEGSLARARLTDDGRRRSGRHDHIDVAKRPAPVRVVPERHASHPDSATHRI